MSFTLTGSGSVVLRNPSWQDSYDVNPNAIQRFTPGGTLKVYASTDWAIVTICKYKFEAITNVYDDYVIDALKQFLRNNRGAQITVEDHLGVTYTGYIISQDVDIVTTKDNCAHDITLDIMKEPE